MSLNCTELIQSLVNDLNAIELPYSEEKIDALDHRSKMLIGRIFGGESSYIEDLHQAFHPITVSSSRDTYETIEQRRRLFWERARVKVGNIFKAILEDCELSSTLNPKRLILENPTYSRRIFIVHGHDEELKQSVARVLEKLGLEPIILHEQPNGGKTIIEKFIDYADVGFAVVLLTPDDLGYSKVDGSDSIKPRARQNVVLELGYFLGALGRERVFVLYRSEPNFEIPSDYQGVLYTSYDPAGHWRFSLVQELNVAKYNVSSDVLLNLR